MPQSFRDIALLARKYKPFLHCTESLKRNDLVTFVYTWQIDTISKF